MAEFAERAAYAAQLTIATDTERAARRQGRWQARYFIGFAVLQLAFVPTVLLWHGPMAVAVATSVNSAAVMALVTYANRRPMTRRGFTRVHTTMIASWAVLYLAALQLGLHIFDGSVLFAAAGALACALPPALAAVHEIRISR